jgi:hypothetical protein
VAKTETPSASWYRVVAVGVLAALVPVLVMSANHGWLNWSVAVTGVLLILTAIGALVLTS